MYYYHCLNPIAQVGLGLFTDVYSPATDEKGADAILVRSASMLESEFGEELKAIARAGAGVNNIPLDRASENGIVVFNTPGANANGVKELVIAALLLASRDIVGGIEWVHENINDADIAKSAEKAKKAFAGNELYGKKLGVIGLGAIGILVANSGVALGMDVLGYDPYLSVDSAWQLSRSIRHAKALEDIFKECDYITLHIPANEETIGMIGKKAIELMKTGTVVLNFSRSTLVDEDEMVAALESGHIKHYVSDFPTTTTAGAKGAIVIPHLGASTEESEDNCAKMAVNQLRDFLENGNIKNSVNFPNCDMGILGTGKTRVLLLHRNIPNMIGQFTGILTQENLNIADMANKNKGAYACTIIDIDSQIPDDLAEKLRAVDGVVRVRIIS
ncbi:MAG: phosphoglycerate dehydrogenase [Lachnospiraceae bacterium]|jgi:D-3-phosphoglycerate dehydrogenase|nr:phosphoglycerate dehydrogenase [Lachnospiraceae bacterium]